MNLFHQRLFSIRRPPFGAIVLAMLGPFLISGCFIDYSRYGQYERSRDAGRLFENNKLPPDYQYYYAGTFAQPDAFIGLDPAYTLDNHLWTRTNPAELQRLMDNMIILAAYDRPIFGSHIIDPNGKVIGIYYSRWRGGPIVMGPDNKVNINLPDKQEGDDDDGDGFTPIIKGN